jgi:hypothetical protein
MAFPLNPYLECIQRRIQFIHLDMHEFAPVWCLFNFDNSHIVHTVQPFQKQSVMHDLFTAAWQRAIFPNAVNQNLRFFVALKVFSVAFA